MFVCESEGQGVTRLKIVGVYGNGHGVKLIVSQRATVATVETVTTVKHHRNKSVATV
jgi:hypothetical protein